MQAPPLDALTINEAAETTGWSARMLRYIERIGLVAPARSQAGYRLYGAAELQRLRTLRELLERFDLGLGEVGFALRLRREPALRAAIEAWLAATPARPEHVPAADWLRFEQEKHQRLLAAARTAATTPARTAARTAATTIPSPTRTLEAA
jgi:MerR family transcriptional regulator, copper efflux regulator